MNNTILSLLTLTMCVLIIDFIIYMIYINTHTGLSPINFTRRFTFRIICFANIILLFFGNGFLASYIYHSKASSTVWLLISVMSFIISLFIYLSIRSYMWITADYNKLQPKADEVRAEYANTLSQLSKDIRSPVNTILGTSELLLNRTFETETLHDLKNIQNATFSLITIMNRIFDLSSINAGTIECTMNEYSTNKLFSEVTVMTNYQLKGSLVSFKTQIDPEIPATLYGDELHLRQLLSYLLLNSIEHTRKGYVKMHVDWHPSQVEDEAILEISILDTAGNNLQTDDNAFQNYTIASYLADLLGGTLQMDYHEGTGNIIQLTLTQKIVQSESMGQLKHITDEDSNVDDTLIVPDAKILVVDDDVVNLTVTCGLLETFQCQITSASNGDECLKLCNINSYDLIFMDHLMPGLDGIETLHELRKQELIYEQTPVPVVVLTANVSVDSREKYIQEGFSDYLTKPVRTDALKKTLQKHLPKNLLQHYVPSREDAKHQKEAQDDSVLFELHQLLLTYLGEFDLDTAMVHCSSDPHQYLGILLSFFTEGKNKVDYIRDTLKNGDLKNFTITVHSLKSISAAIGAIELSNLARAQEDAGSTGNMDYIQEHIENFISVYERVLQKIGTCLKHYETFKKEHNIEQDIVVSDSLPEKEFFFTNIALALEALEDYDLDTCESVCEKLYPFTYPEHVKQKMYRLQQCIKTYNYSMLGDTLRDLLKNDDLFV
ncbi:MAG: response regulator [Lachnospiraceae bacterium]|nr:response regulator [Lachnospiraceae bacterium]